MDATRARRYRAARCAGYTPNAALSFANAENITDRFAVDPEATATHGRQLVGAFRDVVGTQLSLVKGGQRHELTTPAPAFDAAAELVDQLAPVVTVPGQLELGFGGDL